MAKKGQIFKKYDEKERQKIASPDWSENPFSGLAVAKIAGQEKDCNRKRE